MRMLAIIPFLVLSPAAVYGQNMSHSFQKGDGNFQTTVQQGRNLAITSQIGDDNTTLTEQTGTRNSSVIIQRGDGHVQSVTQSGENQHFRSVQISTKHGKRSRTMSRTHSSKVGTTTIFVSID